MGMPRRPLVVCLLTALLFELSLLAGVLASPFFQEWLPHRSLPMDDTTAMLVRWRRSGLPLRTYMNLRIIVTYARLWHGCAIRRRAPLPHPPALCRNRE